MIRRTPPLVAAPAVPGEVTGGVMVSAVETGMARARRFRLHWAVLAFLPLALVDIVLFVLPMLIMGIASLLVIHEFNVTYQLTARNYLFFLSNPLYLDILVRSVLLAAVVTALCLIISYPFAFLITRLSRGAQRILLVL